MPTERKFILYGHAGSYNHGAEAITKCLIHFLRKTVPDAKILLSTHFAEQDRLFSIDADEFLIRNMEGDSNSEIYASTINRIDKNSVCIHIGGDNYCYRNWQRYAQISKVAMERGAVSILWGCSIAPDLIDKEMIKALKTHDLITAREKITYDALLNNGLTKVIKSTDIAFSLTPEPLEFQVENYVAVNISPIIINENSSMKKALEELMDYILIFTNLNIVLIPHCVVSVNNDCDVLRKFYRPRNKRIYLVSDQLSAGQYKTIISKAKFGVFARTHAAIAAYSSSVPTLALGYSVKAHGIAYDLNMSDFVLDANKIQYPGELIKCFKKLTDNEEKIRKELDRRIPEYKSHIFCKQFLNLIT